MGATPSMARAKNTRFVACPGKAEGRTEARRHGTAHRSTPPPPPQPTPRRWNAPDAQTDPTGSAQPQAR